MSSGRFSCSGGCRAEPPPDLIPALPDPKSVDAAFTTERNSWKDIVCPKCQRCICRTYWDVWRCDTDDCHFVLPVEHYVHSAGSLNSDSTTLVVLYHSINTLPRSSNMSPTFLATGEFRNTLSFLGTRQPILWQMPMSIANWGVHIRTVYVHG